MPGSAGPADFRTFQSGPATKRADFVVACKTLLQHSMQRCISAQLAKAHISTACKGLQQSLQEAQINSLQRLTAPEAKPAKAQCCHGCSRGRQLPSASVTDRAHGGEAGNIHPHNQNPYIYIYIYIYTHRLAASLATACKGSYQQSICMLISKPLQAHLGIALKGSYQQVGSPARPTEIRVSKACIASPAFALQEMVRTRSLFRLRCAVVASAPASAEHGAGSRRRGGGAGWAFAAR